MRRFGAVWAGLLCLAGGLRAEFVRPALWGGYTQLGMSQVNATLDGVRKDIEANGGTVTEQTPIGAAWFAALDLDFRLGEAWSLGPRLEWIESQPAVLNAGNGSVTMKTGYGGRLTPLELALKWTPNLRGRLDGSLGAAVGWAWGGVYNKAEVSGPSSRKVETNYSGSAPCGEIDAGLRYRLLPMLSAQAEAGWRWAFLPKATADADEPYIYHVKAGDAATDNAGNPLPMDFGGWKLGAGMALEF
jgi:hypothetical protein